MNARTFFRPTAITIALSVLITAAAVVTMLYIFSCMQDGSGLECVRLPLFVQLLLVGLILPWIGVVRFVGSAYPTIGAVLGIGLSLLWVFLIVCVVRWLGSKVKKTR